MYPAATPDPPKRKGGIALLIGMLLLLAGIGLAIAGIVGGVNSMRNTVAGFERVSLTSGGDVQVREGSYRIYLERPGIDDYGDVSAPPFTIVGPDGNQLLVQGNGNSSETYDFDSHQGRKIGRVSVPADGTYAVQPMLRDGATDTGGVLAFGRRSPLRGVGLILGGVFGGIALGIVGIILVIVGAVRRGRSKRAMLTPPPGVGWPATPTGGGWAPPPGAAPSGPAGWVPPPAQPAAPQPPAPPADKGSWTPPPTDPSEGPVS